MAARSFLVARAATFALLLAAVAAGPSGAAEGDPLARGDAAWARRAEGSSGGRAAPGPIAEAIAAYEEAVRAAPESLEARWKLLRALYFQGDYVAADTAAKREVFGRGRTLQEETLDLVARKVGGRERLDAMEPEAVVRAYAGSPEVARVFFWGAVHWGRWAEAFGKMAAARQGVGGRLLRYGQIVVGLDPLYDDAGGRRLLGGLHAKAPRIPFLTGWVDREFAVEELTRAVADGPGDPFNRLHLAEALLDHAPARRQEALRLLREVAAVEPRPEEWVEDTAAREQAAALLRDLGAS